MPHLPNLEPRQVTFRHEMRYQGLSELAVVIVFSMVSKSDAGEWKHQDPAMA